MKTAQAFTADERRAYIGASEIAAVMGLDKYRNALDVYREKVGLGSPFAGNNHTERGNRLEAIAADYYTEKTGVKLRRRSGAFVHEQHPFIVGHVDRVVEGEKRLVEIKCPSKAAFYGMKRRGLPESYIIQAQVYMALGQVPKLTYVIFCADEWDAAIFDIDFDATIADAAINAAARFWCDHVLPEVPPSFDTPRSDIEIEKVGGDVVIRDDEKFREAAELIREAWGLEKEVKDLKEMAKTRFADAVEGEFGSYEGFGVRVHYKFSEGRLSLDQKAMLADGIDLEKYQKRGNPSASFKPYFLNTQGEQQ